MLPYSFARWWQARRSSRALRELEQRRPDQRATFERLAVRFNERYRTVAPLLDEETTTPPWRAFNAKVEAALLPTPSFDFLQDPVISATMHVSVGGRWLAQQRAFLREHLPAAQLREAALEDPAGAPDLLAPDLLSSHNTLHHLYHLRRFEVETGARLAKQQVVVEWGGGYGNLAKVLHRLDPRDRTYVIVDTPLFSALQWLYLSTTLGEERVVLHDRAPVDLRPGLVHLVPGGLLPHVDVRADLFVSTWALSESSPAAHERVFARSWFGAKHLLLAYQTEDPAFPAATGVGRRAAADGAKIAPIPFIPGNAYAFR